MQGMKRSFLWNTIGSTAYFAAQWLVTFFVLRLGGLEVSGLLSTALNFTNVFISISTFGMRYYQVSDTSHSFSDKSYVKSRFLTCGIGAVLCLGSGLIVGYTLPQLLCISLWLIYRMSEPFSDVYNGICQQNKRLDYVGKSYLARSVFTFVPFMVLLGITKNIFLTLGVMSILVWVVVIFYDIKKAELYFNNSGSTKILPLLIACSPLAVYKLLETASASVPKFFLERQLGFDALGIYSPATSPVLLLQTAASFLLVPLVTVFTSHLDTNNKKAFFQLFIKVCALIFCLLPVGILVCIFLGKWGLSIISPQLADYYYLLIPMVFSAVLMSYTLLFSMLLTILRRLKILIFANLLGLFFAGALSILFINYFNMNGATYALIAALLVQCTIMLIGIIKTRLD